MKSNELKCGNLIYENTYNMGNGNYEAVPIVVNANIIKIIELSPELHAYSPIELTPEILSKIGFSHSGHGQYSLKVYEHWIDIIISTGYCGIGNAALKRRIKHVHTLQNLLEDLTGEELLLTL